MIFALCATAIVIIALFGWKKLPDMARSLGRSARVFKSEVDELKKDGKPTTAASITSGCDTSASSISAGATFSPRLLMTSFLRPRNVYVPSAFSVTRSPVLSQPSGASTAAVSSGIPQ